MTERNRYSASAVKRLVTVFCVFSCISISDAIAGPVDECDQLSAHPDDPGRKTQGKLLDDIPLPEAINICKDAVETEPENLRVIYQYGRSLLADDNDEGEKWIRKAADSGYPHAIYTLGVLEEQRDPPMLIKAADYYRVAASLGHPQSMARLGAMYSEGEGVFRDAVESLNYYKRAAELGDTEAQFWAGQINFSGRGVTKNLFEAERWFSKAAEQQYSPALYFLGFMYLYGEGVQKDETKAFTLLMQSAEQNVEFAYTLIGECYAYGWGTAKDINEAKKWYRKAVEKEYLPGYVGLGWLLVLENNGDSVQEGLNLLMNAAERGDPDAADRLASIYYFGYGVPEDNQKASMWKKEADRLLKLQGESPLHRRHINPWPSRPYG